VTGQEFIDGAEVTSRGGEWGAPLWTFTNAEANLSIDAQGTTLDDAKAKAVPAADSILAARA
jgi:hypothetical protein